MRTHTPSSYSRLDRGLHKLAFGSRALQGILADMEHSLYAGRWQDITIEKPVFITSLPRAGTTIVLETLYRISNLATHTYRDMPFILTPVIWQKLSRLFRRTSKPKERAHGDGLVINEDSPEAFEEVLWKKYFPDNFDKAGIRGWQDTQQHAVFEDVFKAHIQKIIMLRRADAVSSPRYISKNNANIARVGYLQAVFPDALFVVPVRHPVEQAISLLRQHQNFATQHADDAFSGKYMADIGHYEFGDLHRAIEFPGLAELTESRVPDSLDYWIAYWIAAFQDLSRHEHICFVGFEELCQGAKTILPILLGRLELSANKESMEKAVQNFRLPVKRWQEGYTANPALVEQALECYRSLQGRFIG